MGDMRLLLEACVLLILITGCKPQTKQAPPPATEKRRAEWFQRITDQSGVQFTHLAGTNYSMLDQVASGVALLDYDRDGNLDLYLIQNTTTNAPTGNQLYRGEG